MKTIITFNESSRNEILEAFGKTFDKERRIVEKSNPEQRVLTPDGEEINIDEFAGIIKGSQIFVKSDLPSLIKFSKRRE